MALIGVDARLWNETGVGRYIRNLVKELDKLSPQHEFVFFALSKDHENIKSQIANLTYKIVTADIQWHTVAEQLKFPRLLEKENLDLVHFPYFSVSFLTNIPFVVTVHDLILHHFSTGKASTHNPLFYNLKYQGYKLVLSQTIQRAKKIITVSHETKKEILTHYKIPQEKIEVTYEGIDKATLTSLSKQSKERVPYFLYVGNAYPHKNLETLLIAFKKFLQTHREPIELICVGKEDYFYERLKATIAHMNLTGSVIFYDKITDAQLANLYQHAVALVLPSLMEGFGLPALEAMANECLVICSQIPAFQEICQKACLYINPQDADDIAQKLAYVIQAKKSEIQEKKTMGKARAKDFSWEKMAQETLAIYENCLSV